MAIKVCPRCGSPGVVCMSGFEIISKQDEPLYNKNAEELWICRICGETFYAYNDDNGD